MKTTTTLLIPSSPHIAVDVSGEGPLLIFLHGIGGNRTNWQDQLLAFAEYFKAVSWDARGYGGSEDYEGSLEFGDFTKDLLRVVDFFQASKVHLVGLSMGGRIAMHFCLHYPDRVATLTLVDTHEGFTSFTEEKRREFVETRRAPLMAGKQPSDIAPGVAASLAGPKATPAQRQRLVESIAALHKDSYIKSLQATVDQVTVGDIRKITAPTHFIVGADDPLTPPALHYEMAAKIANARVTIIPDAGHLSNIENPDAFNVAALDWLLARQ
jgi:3-oxoadipate enol-lactonase